MEQINPGILSKNKNDVRADLFRKMSQKTTFGTSKVDFCRKNLPKTEIVPKLISSGKCVKKH